MNEIERFLKTYLHDKAPFHFRPASRILSKIRPMVHLNSHLISIPALLIAFGLTTIVMPFAAQVAESSRWQLLALSFLWLL